MFTRYDWSPRSEALELWHDAADAFAAEAKQSPINAEALAKAGDMYNAILQKDVAIQWYQRSIAVEPALTWPHYNLGVLEDERGNHQVAMGHYQQYLILRPDDGNAWNNVALLLRQQKRTEEALQAAEKAVELGPRVAHFRFNLGIIWADRKCFSKAAEEWFAALRLDPAFSHPQKQLDKLSTQLGIDHIDDSVIRQLGIKEKTTGVCR